MELGKTPIVFLGTDERRNALWMKRDDLLPFCFGGNKARIADEFMRDMEAQGRDHMIAYGNARSNLCRALSNLCAARGVPCTLLSPADDDGRREASYNQQMARAFGAEVVPCLKSNVATAVDEALAQSRARGRKPYYIYGNRMGDGNLQTPVRAYEKVYRELLEQQTELGVCFDELFLATGTGMTQAGLLCGQSRLGGEMRIRGISIARSEESGKAHIRRYLQGSLGGAADGIDISLTDIYALSYGAYSAEMVDCARDVMTRYGVPLDLTYTGKAFYGMRCELSRRELHDKQVLFLHTGGTPLFFDKATEIFGLGGR